MCKDVSDFEHGMFAVSPIHHFEKGQGIPDYAICFGHFRNRNKAEKEAYKQRTLRNQCIIVYQI